MEVSCIQWNFFDMLIEVVLFFCGLGLLYVGAELLVGSASRIALLLKVAPIVVGLTVVAFGTSSPEFLVSFIAAVRGQIDVSVGNIVGSNIANIGLVLAFSTLLRPIRRIKANIREELIWVLAATLLFWFFAWDNVFVWYEGAVMTLGIFLFTGILIRQSIRDRNLSLEDVPPVETRWHWLDRQTKVMKMILFSVGVVAGITVLAWGSRLTIDSAVSIARHLGVSQIVIGLTMVAFGTSLPELATGIISVAKKENEILVGNVIGSNLFNILGVAGPIALFFKIPVREHALVFDFPVMMVFTVLLFIALWVYKSLNRLFGFLFFAAYIFYILYTIWAG